MKCISFVQISCAVHFLLAGSCVFELDSSSVVNANSCAFHIVFMFDTNKRIVLFLW